MNSSFFDHFYVMPPLTNGVHYTVLAPFHFEFEKNGPVDYIMQERFSTEYITGNVLAPYNNPNRSPFR